MARPYKLTRTVDLACPSCGANNHLPPYKRPDPARPLLRVTTGVCWSPSCRSFITVRIEATP